MKLRLLLPLATLLGFIIITLQVGTKTAQADLVGLSLSTNNTVFGDTVTVTATVNNAAGNVITLRVSSGALTQATTTSGTAVSGNGTNSISLTGAAGTTSETITARYQCN